MKGSISDLGIAELMQFPAMSAKSGRLSITRDDQNAQLFYKEGELHHASLGELTGFPVLVEILPWRKGNFEFEIDVGTDERTIDMDLGKALMRATIQGEEQQDAKHVLATAAFQHHFGPTWDGATFARVTSFLLDQPIFFYACVMLRGGDVKAEYLKPDDSLQETAQTYSLLRDMMKNYAHVVKDHLLVDGSYCTVAIRAFGQDEVLIAFAKSDTSPEHVQQAIDSLVEKLEG